MTQTSSKPAQRPAQTESITLDCDHILTYAGGDSGQLMQLCAAFLTELPMYTSEFANSFQRRETSAAERAVQNLRGCLRVFGTGPVIFTLETLGYALLGGRRAQARREWLRLQRQLRALVPQVQRLMLEISPPCGPVQ